MSRNNFTPQGSARGTKRTVIYTGSTDLVKGQWLCYDRDYGTAASVDGNRDVYVELPSLTNNLGSAGACCEDVTADASGKTVIEIWEPGSVCEVSTLIATTVNSTRLTALAASGSPGRFATAGRGGNGTAVALQSLTAIAAITDLGVGVFSSSLDGTAALTISGTTYTLVKASAFTYVPLTDDLTGTEYVHIVAGSTAAGGTIQPTAGRYKITAKTDNDTVILDPAGTAPSASSVDVAFYCVRGNPTVLAKLEGCNGGVESGLVDWISPDSANTTTISQMAGGYTYVFGGFDQTTESAITLANGLFPGMRKDFKLIADIATSGFKITVTTGVVHNTGGATATASYSVCGSVVLDKAGDEFHAEWSGTSWLVDAWNFTVANNPTIA